MRGFNFLAPPLIFSAPMSPIGRKILWGGGFGGSSDRARKSAFLRIFGVLCPKLFLVQRIVYKKEHVVLISSLNLTVEVV